MNNYNELMNKPTINNKELIGNIIIKSDLPKVTSEDVGKVAIVGEDGTWTVGTVKGGSGFDATFNKSNIMTVKEGE